MEDAFLAIGHRRGVVADLGLPARAPGPVTTLRGLGSGLALGAGLRFASRRLLGQYDGYTGADTLYLVAPTIVRLERGQVVDRFQSLMKTGVYIPGFITQLTGITNTMVAAAPDAREVMREAARFVGDTPMVAHNAAFDSKFWLSELAHAGLGAPQPFACTVLLSRRLYPQAPSHKLGALVDYHHLPRTGRAHRALADAEMAAALLAQIQHDLRHRWGVGQPTHELLMTLQRCAKPKIGGLLREWALAHPVQAELLVSSP